jgi:hypothetical protein
MRNTIALLLMACIIGCQSRSEPTKAAKNKEHDHYSHDHRGSEHKHSETGHGAHEAKSGLTLRIVPLQLVSGESTKLKLMVHDSQNKMLKDFEPTHEKLVHLIIIDKGMSQFAHLHPEVAVDGSMTVAHAFPQGGEYYVYADIKPKGQSPETVRETITVKGEPGSPASLQNTVPGVVNGEGWSAKVTVSAAKPGESAVSFVFKNGDKVLSDLEPYLGAMGHLVVVNTKDGEYAHSHPDEKQTPGTVRFMVHFAKPGVYKGWGQFKRSNKVFDVPFVVHVN